MFYGETHEEGILHLISDADYEFAPSDETRDEFYYIKNAGDLDGDGFFDIVVGDENIWGQGRFIVFY